MMKKYKFVVCCLVLFNYGDIIYQDNMDNLDDWIIIGNSYADNVVNSEYCPSNICSYISEHSSIYRSFNILGYIDLNVKYSIDIGGDDNIGCRGKSCDYFYAFYQCGYIIHVLEIYDKNSNGFYDEMFDLSNECDGMDALIIYFHANVNNPLEKAYIDDLIIEGTVGLNHVIMDDLIYENKLDNISTFEYYGDDVSVHKDKEYCVPNDCVKMSDISSILLSNIDVSGYENISLYYDVNIAPQDYFHDSNQELHVFLSCNGNEYINIKTYGIMDENDPHYDISRYYVGERFDILEDICIDVDFISIKFELNAITKSVYIGNVYVFGKHLTSNITTTNTNINISTTQSIKTDNLLLYPYFSLQHM